MPRVIIPDYIRKAIDEADENAERVPIVGIPKYNGACIYALMDDERRMYIGSTSQCNTRMKQHYTGMRKLYKGENHRLLYNIATGGKFTALVLEMCDDKDAVLQEREQYYIDYYGERAWYNLREATRGSAIEWKKWKGGQT